MASVLRAVRWRRVGIALSIAIGVATTLVLGLGVVLALGLGGTWVGYVIGYSILWGPVCCLVAISWIWLWREFSAEAGDRGWDKPRRRREVLWLLLLGPIYIWHLRQNPLA